MRIQCLEKFFLSAGQSGIADAVVGFTRILVSIIKLVRRGWSVRGETTDEFVAFHADHPRVIVFAELLFPPGFQGELRMLRKKTVSGEGYSIHPKPTGQLAARA